MDLISVIVPIYNVEKYLKKCIDSIINQTYKNIEVILVDDESPDNCPRICDEYKEIDNRIKVIHQKNMGLSGARNSGIDFAKGKYIMFQDSDDTIEPDCIKKLYDLVKKDKTILAVCGRYYEFEDGTKYCKYKEKITKVYNFEDAIEEMNNYYYFDMSAGGKLYKKEIFDDIRFPIGKLSEDFFVMYKIFMKAKRISYTSDPLYNYLQRQNSISRNKKVNTQFIDAAYEQMKDLENYSEKMKIIVHTAYASSYLTVIDMYIKQKIKCPKEMIKKAKIVIKENKKYIKNNRNISKSKKIQFNIFYFNYLIYKIIFTVYRKIKKV